MKQVLCGLSGLACLFGYSQAPALTNYQGLAQGEEGTPLINRTLALRFELSQGSTASYPYNMLIIGGCRYRLDSPIVYASGYGISVTGTMITRSTPDRTVTMQPENCNTQNIRAYPDSVVTSTLRIAFTDGQFSISNGNTMSTAPILHFSGSTLSVERGHEGVWIQHSPF